jgi:hypothetical protein
MRKNIIVSLLVSMLFVSQSFANARVEIEVHTVQTNVNAAVNISENCTFTGWMRDEKEVSFYATCDDIKKSITVKDGGLLNNFVVKTVSQDVSIQLDVYKSSGIDWDKLNKALSENHATEE